MINFYNEYFQSQVAKGLLATIIFNILAPPTAYALTGGPTQPEFSSFEPVSTNQMVDEFTGDFTYNLPVLNIPGPAGSDYPLSLSYHSGASPEEEASWVGYGWTLNPGAIIRNTRGFPDDYKGETVTYWNKAPKNWTATVGVGAATEIFGKDLGANGSVALRYNSYQGYGYNIGAGISLGKGISNLGYGLTDGQSSYSASINPAAILMRTKANNHKHESKSKDRYKLRPYRLRQPNKPISQASISVLGGNYGLLSYSEAIRSNHVSKYTGAAFNISANLQINFPPVPIGPTVNINGSYSYQTNEEQKNAPAYGYMYSGYLYNSNNERVNDDAIGDYYLEKDTPYNKRDVFLGVPLNNADQFSVSGEGIGGSFRLYHERIGEFTPNSVTSSIVIGNLSPEVSAGLTFGAGSDVGVGLHQLIEGPWQKQFREFSKAKENGEEKKAFFRFANDLGGDWSSNSSDEPILEKASRNGPSNTALGPRNTAQPANRVYPFASAGRSSYVAYHTKGELYDGTNKKLGRGFSKGTEIPLPINVSDLSADAICEMSTVTANGTRYIYGLPLLNRNEKNLQYGLSAEAPGNIKNNYLAYTDKSDAQMSAISGEERNTPYAGSFLLTETHTPDYVDRTFNGPTADDFGGYTRFNYTKQSGWYNWRTPYTGLLYQANSLSDPMDDVGTMSYGQKEIAIVHSIQTKTHTAIFKVAQRADGYDASGPGARTTNDIAYSVNGRHALVYLERIELYANADIEIQPSSGYPTPMMKMSSNGQMVSAKPIKTVRFKYRSSTDASTLCHNLPNAASGAGKLTLEKVWFEYQGIETQISPYTFSYSYPSQAQYNLYPSRYSSFALSFSDQAQNPNYSPYSLDAWGNYQTDGDNRFAHQRSWLDQKANNNFDPAAWQLKVITLPTGGQIHVQYEQDDYAYVQDKPAHVMVPLLPVGSETDNSYGRENGFDIDLAAIGITSAGDVLATQQAIEREYRTQPGRKMHFKFLYNLLGDTSPSLSPIACNSEYISGYATVSSTEVIGSRLKIYLNSSGYNLPKKVCQNFATTQRSGKLNAPGVCDPSLNGLNDQGMGPASLMRYILQRFGSIVGLTNSCAALSPRDSYFRIPVIKAKKGGGLRVKRLLTFDEGYDGEHVLYGSEYLYQVWEPTLGRMISSGVATTEPGGQREENILVDFIPRGTQDWWSKIVAGEDLKQSEGPLGESLLPAPLVGYSRVVTRNIHSGRTNTGYSISEFATAREYSMQLKQTNIQSDKQFRILSVGLATDQVNNLYASQGFSFILNNMHGQPTRKATYPGNYNGQLAERESAPSSQQVYTYYQPGKFTNDVWQPADNVKVVSEKDANLQGHPGREVDITSAERSVKDIMYDLNVEFDVDVAFLFFISLGFFTAFPTLTRSQAEFGTHATTKVIRYPAILKKVETTQDGIVHTSENLAFDKYTGQPITVKTNDEFGGSYTQETKMASWVHPELGSKATSEELILDATSSGTMWINVIDQKVYLNFSGTACDGLARLTRGDLVALTGNGLDDMVFHIDKPDFFAKRVRIYPVVLPTSSQSFQTVNSAAPLSGAGNTQVSSLAMLTSGHTNELAAVAGSTTYHNRADLLSNQLVSSSKPTLLLSHLNSQLPAPSTNPVTITLVGPYPDMNVSAFAGLIPVSSGINPAKTAIQNVKVTVVAGENGQRLISIDELEIPVTGGSPIIVKNPQ